MLNALKYSICLLILASIGCSKNHELTDNNHNDSTAVEAPMSLYSETATGKPFDQFYIELHNLNGTLLNYFNAYDSVVSSSSKGDTALYLLNQNSGAHIFYNSWTITFYTPGNFYIYLKGYKNGSVILQDSLNFEVKNDTTSDFLKFKWTDPTTDNIGYETPYMKNFFTVLKRKDGDNDYINVYEWPENSSLELISAKQQINDLYNLMYGNYGNPVFSDSLNHSSITIEYQSIFRIKDSNSTPVALWKTSKTNIVLLKNMDGCYLHTEKSKQ